MGRHERNSADFFRFDRRAAGFAEGVPKDHLPPGPVCPVGPGGAAAAGPCQSSGAALQRADGGGAGADPGGGAAGTADRCPSGGAGPPGPAPGGPGRRARNPGKYRAAACRTPGICGHRQLGGRHGYHRRPLPPDDYGGGADCRLVRRYGGHGGLVPLYQPPLCP